MMADSLYRTQLPAAPPFPWGPVQALELSIYFLFQTAVCSVVPELQGKKVFH